MGSVAWLVVVLGVGFLAYLIYTRQFGWLVRVGRNMLVGAGGMLLFNMLLGNFGIRVGINAVTALVVGLLGAPGFLLLYATQAMMG